MADRENHTLGAHDEGSCNVHQKHERLLVLEVRSRRFGFAVFEGRGLLDWGARRDEKAVVAARRLEPLAEYYAPTVAVARQIGRTPKRSRDATSATMRTIRRVLGRHGIEFMVLSRRKVNGFFAKYGCRSKHERAVMIVRQFPSLAPMLPKPKRPWQHESYVMAIFDAIATWMVYVGPLACPDKSSSSPRTSPSEQ